MLAVDEVEACARTVDGVANVAGLALVLEWAEGVPPSTYDALDGIDGFAVSVLEQWPVYRIRAAVLADLHDEAPVRVVGVRRNECVRAINFEHWPSWSPSIPNEPTVKEGLCSWSAGSRLCGERFDPIPLRRNELVYSLGLSAQGCSSAGRAAVSKTAGRGFESCRPCQFSAYGRN